MVRVYRDVVFGLAQCISRFHSAGRAGQLEIQGFCSEVRGYRVQG